MATAVTVLYPDVEGSTFDMDYYLATHMPLVADSFASHGMTGWRVARFVGTPDGGRPAFGVVATLEFGSADGFRAALAAAGRTVLGDVPNFTDQQPVIMIGEVLGHA